MSATDCWLALFGVAKKSSSLARSLISQAYTSSVSTRASFLFFRTMSKYGTMSSYMSVIVATGVNDADEIGSVLRLDVRFDGRFDGLRSTDSELCLTELHPNPRFVDLARVLDTTIEIFERFEKNLHGYDVEVELLEDGECFLVQLVSSRDFLDRTVERIQTVYVVHHATRPP